MNYYELFGIEVSPKVDNTYVAKKYIELQKQNHPDFFSQEDEDAKADAEEMSANINKAYQTFINKEKAIEYFLKIKGAMLPEEKYSLPPEFLLEMMDINEMLSDGNAKGAEQAIEEWSEKIIGDIQPLLQNPQQIDDAGVSKLKEYYFKKKYLQRILDRLED